MRIETPKKALNLHQPDDSATDQTVFAFDRDYTVDVNPPPNDDYEAVPLEWITYLAHKTDHIVYATGNQVLKQEAVIPGNAEIVAAHQAATPGDIANTDREITRQRLVQMLGELYENAGQLIVVDDTDLSELSEWNHYFPWDFVPAARCGEVVSELPPSTQALSKIQDLVENFES